MSERAAVYEVQRDGLADAIGNQELSVKYGSVFYLVAPTWSRAIGIACSIAGGPQYVGSVRRLSQGVVIDVDLARFCVEEDERGGGAVQLVELALEDGES